MFALGTFAKADESFVGLVVDDRVVPLQAAGLPEVHELADLLADWPRSFDGLQRIAENVDHHQAAVSLSDLQVLPPVRRPGKILNAAANYRDHAERMRKHFSGGAVDMKGDYGFDKGKGRPYLFLRASSTISGAFDPIELPEGMERIDWEAELGAVIGPAVRHARVETALEHVAGYVVTNDISCRDLTWREDRPALRSDWLSGKSFDSFAPTGPLFVPRQFVPDYRDLRICLWVNGVLKQDGRAGDMIFSIEEQIEYASRMMTLEPGDLFATGTPAGTGQERGEFLKPGDIVETEIAPLGRQRNVVVAARSAARPIRAAI